jgi:hypothetical protein
MTSVEKAKEQPIIFTGESIPVIFEGRKTQTRRIVKPQPPKGAYLAHYSTVSPDWTWAVAPWTTTRRRCPYGRPGDRLWVKEAWLYVGPGSGSSLPDDEALIKLPENQLVSNCWYRATYDGSQSLMWSNSRYMPRWASQIDLEVTGIRAERLQNITEQDIRAEGVEPPDDLGTQDRARWDAREAFAALWESIHGKGAWERNPWVWVIEFKQVGGAG